RGPLMRRFLLLFVLLLVAAAPAALAYNILLKNKSIVFAREKYTVKGNKAIITLQNGTVVSYDLDQIDVPATEQYNKENPANVAPGDAGRERVARVPTAPPPATTLQEVIRRKNMTLGATAPKKEAGPAAAGAAQVVEPAIDQAFHRILDGASITQYRLAGYGGKIRLLATANTEEAVFNTLAAAARAVADLGNQGKETTIDIVLTTSGGDSG